MAEISITQMHDWKDNVDLELEAPQGISEEIVELISKHKNEPEWMLQKRLHCLKLFKEMKMPAWGPSLEKLDMQNIKYFQVPNSKKNAKSWEELPEEIKKTFEKLGIPEAEKKALSGAGAQYESTILYHNLKKEWEEKGIIFEDMDAALKKYPEIVKEYFMTCVPPTLHKFAALHGAVWSGGTFIYVPKKVKLTTPLQAYFRMNAERGGQFEHTLIIVDEEAEMHYVEGCSAPQYTTSSLHAGCVEVIVKKNARARYSSVENWSRNTFNLNTKRAIVEENGIMEWIGGNIGSGCTMLYPCTILKGDRSRTEHIAIAFAGKGQNQDTGAKVYHVGKNTSSHVTSKSISIDGGITSYRGIIHSSKQASNVKSAVECDALMIDNKSQSNTYPVIKVENDSTQIAHEATVGRISPEKIFYITSRGLSEEEAKKLIVSGFIEPITKQLPLEYAVELNKLIDLEMEGSLG